MNAKLIIYCKEKIQNYESLKQLCLLMNIEIILLNEQMTQNKVKDILNKKIKKTKKIRMLKHPNLFGYPKI